MVVCFSALLVELEWSEAVEQCASEWVRLGVSHSFIRKHREGPVWDCSICDVHGWDPHDTAAMATLLSSAAAGTAEMHAAAQHCATCPGYPPGHPECLGGVWGQSYPDVPTAMWFLMVTVTPAVNLDPTDSNGRRRSGSK